MASLIFDSFFDDLAKANVVPNTDTYYLMLVNGYAPNKATHTKRSDVTSESTGVGYTTGGVAITCAVAKDTVNHRETFTYGPGTFTAVTLTTTGAVIYKHRGGAASADELVAFVDFNGPQTATGANLIATFSSPLTIQN